MVAEFRLELIEEKKELLYVAGISMSALAVGNYFLQLNQYQKKKKHKKGTFSLEVVSIIVQGEPVESIEADVSAMLALAGDWQSIPDFVEKARWRRKGQRFMRNDDSVLSLSGETYKNFVLP